MQPILANPRQALLPSLVTGLLQTLPNIKIAYGARRLDPSLNELDDISGFMSSGCTVDSDSSATIHRTCTLMLDSDNPVRYGQDLVQPYMTIIDANTEEEATFNLGVYTLASPTYDNSNLPSILTLTGYDLLYYINTVIGDSVQIAAGADPIAAATTLVVAAFPNAIVQATPTTSTLTAALTFPFDDSHDGTTYLEVINALLGAIGYQPLWVDWEGQFQLQPYAAPSTRDPEWTFDINADDNIVAEQRTSVQDLFSVPNTWQFVMTDLKVSPIEGETQFTYIDASPINPGSTYNRARTVRKTQFVKAADYASLVAYGLSIVVQDLSPAETFAISTSPFPLAWHYDQILMYDPNLFSVPPAYTGTRRVQAVKWTLPLDGLSDMMWTWQTVFA